MTRLTFIQASIVAVTISAAVPIATSAASAPPECEAGATHCRPVPADTAKADKGKSDHASSAKRKLKAHQNATIPSQLDPHQFVPDQRWETEFFVENGRVSQPHHTVAVAAFFPESQPR